MHMLKSEKGMTLIEVILAMAIMGIVIISFLDIFAVGYKYIVNAGLRSKNNYVNQKEIENSIATEGTGSPVTLNFTYGTSTFEVTGLKTTKGSYNNFLPMDIVIIHPTNFTVSPSFITLPTIGSTETIEVVFAPIDTTNKNITWETSDSSVASVVSGLVYGEGAGNAIITATAEDTKNGILKKTISVTVSNTVKSSNATLSSITLQGATGLTPAFNSSVLAYTQTGNGGCPNVIAVASDIKATVSIVQAANRSNKNVATITVTAEDGTKKIYTVTFK